MKQKRIPDIPCQKIQGFDHTGKRIVCTTRSAPKQIEDLISSALAKRRIPIKIGICYTCKEDFYTFGITGRRRAGLPFPPRNKNIPNRSQSWRK